MKRVIMVNVLMIHKSNLGWYIDSVHDTYENAVKEGNHLKHTDSNLMFRVSGDMFIRKEIGVVEV